MAVQGTIYVTGKQSGFARLLEIAIKSKKDVEIILQDGEPIYAKIRRYDWFPPILVIVVENGKNVEAINFQAIKEVRFGKLEEAL